MSDDVGKSDERGPPSMTAGNFELAGQQNGLPSRNRCVSCSALNMKPDNEAVRMLDKILVDAYGEDEQLFAFMMAFQDEVPLPAEGSVLGQAVSVTKIEYAGDSRRGLTAMCAKADGTTYEVAVSDVVFPDDSKATLFAKAYQAWLGRGAELKSQLAAQRERIKETKAGVGQIDITKPAELIVLGIKQETARCKLVETGKELTLRSADLWNAVPGEIITVNSRKHWSYAGHPYLSGDITSMRFDLAALRLTPLGLNERGIYDPKDEYWGEEGTPIEAWAQAVIDRGPRPQYEIEQVTSLVRPEDYDVDDDPITNAVELRNAGEYLEAQKALAEQLTCDLRCLDAHAHLGNFEFDGSPEKALRHYDIGRQIAELSLDKDFEGALPWGFLDNRPYLRCLHGYGLCLWRLKRFDEAADVFSRMLWLNPADNQGARLLIVEVCAGKEWEEHRDA
jgi:hypothetical protein